MKNHLYMLCGLLPLVLGIRSREYIATDTLWETKLLPDDTAGAVVFDDFTSGWHNGWQGNTTAFEIAEHRLTLLAEATSPAYLARPVTRLRNTIWEMGIHVNSALAVNNYVRLYLISTNPSLHGSQQGYHLQIDGANGKHVYHLWRQDGNTRQVIFRSDSIESQSAAFRARVRVVCNRDGHWQIFADENDSGSFEQVSGKASTLPHVNDIYVTDYYTGYAVNFSPIRYADFRLHYILIRPFDLMDDPVSHNTVLPQDILINELLSYPKTNGADFVEIYNYSDKIIDLRKIHIANVSSSGSAGTKRAITNQQSFIYPNEYKVLTSQPAIIQQHYPNSVPHTFITVPALPNFNNEIGGVVLYSDSLTIDSLFYTKNMQSPFIVDHRGVSLERRHFSMPTLAPGNFQSAATAVGGATPGYANSQGVIDGSQENVRLVSKTFSPDGDGFEDYLEISYRLPESGYMANISIYNDNGRLVKQLQRNQSLGTNGSILWDGMADNGRRQPVGVYIAVIELYHASGRRRTYRLSFALAAKL